MNIEQRSAITNSETRSCSMQVKAVGSNGEVEGYASVFGVLDNYDDIIVPGAFAESMAAHKSAGTMPAMLREHASREAIGVWTDMVET